VWRRALGPLTVLKHLSQGSGIITCIGTLPIGKDDEETT